MSGYIKQHLPIVLVNHLTAEKDPKKALTSGFLEVDRTMGSSRIDCEFSGSTAVVAYLKVGPPLMLSTTATAVSLHYVQGRFLQ